MTMTSHSSFAGESWLEPDILPESFGKAASRVAMYLTMAFTIWCVLVPLMGVLAMQEEFEEQMEQQQSEEQQQQQQSEDSTSNSSNSSSTRRGKTKKQSQESQESPFQANNFRNNNNNSKSNNQNNQQSSSAFSTTDIFYLGFFTLSGLFWSTLLIFLFISPYNALLGRGVLQVHGMLSSSECEHLKTHIIRDTAQRNIQVVEESDDMDDPFGYLDAPKGYAKRSSSMITETTPVANLDWFQHPFTAKDKEWLTKTLLDTRLAPTLRRLYGMTLASIQLQELYVEHYQAGSQRTERTMILKSPNKPLVATDHDVVFRIELSDKNTQYLPTTTQTHFWNAFSQTFFSYDDENPSQQGTLLLHNNRLPTKEAPPLVSGQRTILVGTISLERTITTTSSDDSSASSTGLSALATFTNFPWIVTRLERFIQHQFDAYHYQIRLFCPNSSRFPRSGNFPNLDEVSCHDHSVQGAWGRLSTSLGWW